MNDNEIKMFRSQIGGFNRDDVIQYIKESDRKHADETAALKASLEEAKREAAEAKEAAESAEAKALGAEEAAKVIRDERDALSASLKDTEARLSETEKSLGENAAAYNELSKKMDFYKTQSEAQVRVIENLRKESADAASSAERANLELAEIHERLAETEKQLKEKEAALSEAFEAAQNAIELGDISDKNSIAYKLEMYDKISAQLGDILINANRTAEETLAVAKNDAEKLRKETAAECEHKRAACDAAIARVKAETEEEAATVRERLSVAATETLDAVSNDLHTSIEQCVREVNTCVADMQYEIKTLLAKLSGRSDEMSDKVQYFQNGIAEGIEDKLAKMNDKYGIHPLTERSYDDPV